MIYAFRLNEQIIHQRWHRRDTKRVVISELILICSRCATNSRNLKKMNKRYWHSSNLDIEEKLESRADRFIAYIIDTILFVLIGGGLGALWVLSSDSNTVIDTYEANAFGFAVAGGLLVIAYRLFFILRYSATPGQLAMKMRYVAVEEGQQTKDTALIKQAVFRPLYNAIPVLSFVVLIIELGVLFTRKDKRSLSNLVSGVLVMKLSKIQEIGATEVDGYNDEKNDKSIEALDH